MLFVTGQNFYRGLAMCALVTIFSIVRFLWIKSGLKQRHTTLRTVPDVEETPVELDTLENILKFDNTLVNITTLRKIKYRHVTGLLSNLQPGGYHQPIGVTKPYKIAIIVPFRSREYMLMDFLVYMHAFLQRQRVEYRIYISEQLNPTDVFNKGATFNVGFLQARRDQRWDCYFFHDVDLLPENGLNKYRCLHSPVHYSNFINKWNYKHAYPHLLGGVAALMEEQYVRANGFSNDYWGWGGEDEDFRNRLISAGYLRIYRQSARVGRMTMLKHRPLEKDNVLMEYRLRLRGVTRFSRATYLADGLSTLRYSLHRRTLHPFYTWVLSSFNKTELALLRAERYDMLRNDSVLAKVEKRYVPDVIV